MPNLYNSKINGSCPLKVGQLITYSTLFKFTPENSPWNLFNDKALLRFNVDIRRTNEPFPMAPLFSVHVPIELKRCWFYVIC